MSVFNESGVSTLTPLTIGSEQASSSKVGASNLRGATRMTIVDQSHVESPQEATAGIIPSIAPTANTKVRTKDVIRIFVDETDQDFMQVTPEQLERVRAMHHKMSSAAKFSFNYNTLLLVASLLAGLGLVSNSSATIIASMLVSPIMG